MNPSLGIELHGASFCPQGLMLIRLQLTALLESSKQPPCCRQLCKPLLTAWLKRHCYRRLSNDALEASPPPPPPPLEPQHSAREAQAAVECGMFSSLLYIHPHHWSICASTCGPDNLKGQQSTDRLGVHVSVQSPACVCLLSVCTATDRAPVLRYARHSIPAGLSVGHIARCTVLAGGSIQEYNVNVRALGQMLGNLV